MLGLGGATAVMGVLYAPMQHDLKRLLAYHTVENIGIIFIGLRLALAFKAHGMAVAAAIAMTAALLHVLNQALERTYNATPDPKWVVAIGDCALDGGVFAGSYAVVGGVSSVVPVDLHIRGCPPSPAAILKRIDRAGHLHESSKARLTTVGRINSRTRDRRSYPRASGDSRGRTAFRAPARSTPWRRPCRP